MMVCAQEHGIPAPNSWLACRTVCRLRNCTLAGSRKRLCDNGTQRSGERHLTTAASTLYHGTSQRPLQARHSDFLAQQRSSAAGPLDAGGTNGQPGAPAEVSAQGLPGADPSAVTSAAERVLQGSSGGDAGSAQGKLGAEAGASTGVPGEGGEGGRDAPVASRLERPPLSRESVSSGAPHSPGWRRVSAAASDDVAEVGLCSLHWLAGQGA